MGILQQLTAGIFPKNEFEKTLNRYNSGRKRADRYSICHAPFKNMYFGHGGIVSACCFNRSHALGIWPHQSISEIWNSAKADALRNALKKSDFTLGCSNCGLQLESKNFTGYKGAQYDGFPLNKDHMPSVLEFELDNTCNLACKMCNEEYSSVIASNKGLAKHRSPYNADFIKELEVFLPHIVEAKFYGGEPFMIKVYYDIWEKIIEVNPECRIVVQTNATIINDRVLNILKHGKLHINISIDSLIPEEYARIRIGAQLDETLQSIQTFHKYCREKGTGFNISVCMMQQNAFEAPAFIRFCNELQAPVYFHTVFDPVDCALHSWEKDKLQELCTYLEENRMNAAKTEVEKANLQHYDDFINQVKYWIGHDHQPQLLSEEQVESFLKEFESRLATAAGALYGMEKGSELAKQYFINLRRILEKRPEEEHFALLRKARYQLIFTPVESYISQHIDELEQYLLQALQ